MGKVILSSVFFINSYIWILFFDADGFLTQKNKNLFLFFDIILVVVGLTLLLYKFTFDSKKSASQVFYILYIIVFFELLSWATIKLILFRDDTVKDRVEYALGDLKKNSKHVSYITADLRTDYRLNKFSTKVNNSGFRHGGYNTKDKPYKIMCLGGSTTFGSGVQDSTDTYPFQLELFMKENRFDVHVINAGIPYYTSLDVLNRYITKGIYLKPDMILIHTGGNDTGPLNSPNDYLPDYTHWRDNAVYNKDEVFKSLWNNYPSSTIRLFLIFYFKPGTGTRNSHQSSLPIDELVSMSPVTRNRTIGLQNYFSSIISISKYNDIQPVTILFNNDQNRNNSQARRYFEDEKMDFAIRKKNKSIKLHNSIMDSISNANNVNVIPFDKFEPSSKAYWTDQCHLGKNGNKEKAAFIGKYLINNFEFPTLFDR